MKLAEQICQILYSECNPTHRAYMISHIQEWLDVQGELDAPPAELAKKFDDWMDWSERELEGADEP